MKLQDAKISILIDRDWTTIEIHDSKAATTFVKVKLTPAQLSSALSRLAMTECEAEVGDLDRVGKTHEWKSFEFEISGSADASLNQACQKAMKKAGLKDWISDDYYSSQNSFFSKEGKNYARVTIRRYI